MTKRDELSDGRQGRLEESRQGGGREEESLKARLDRLSTALDAQAEADKASGATKTGQDGASPGAIGNAMSSRDSRPERVRGGGDGRHRHRMGNRPHRRDFAGVSYRLSPFGSGGGILERLSHSHEASRQRDE